MELNEALSQITEIRQRMAGAQVFRGYRAVTTAFSALLAIGAAVGQSVWIPQPAEHLGAYIALWVSAAVLSSIVVGAEIILRHWRMASPMRRDITILAIEQFIPSVVAGGLLTFVLWRSPQTLWILPGLWAILFGLGILASGRLLPRGVSWVGAFYLAAGMVCLAVAKDADAFSPWAMGVTFGVGQFLAAGALYWTLERKHATQA